MNGNENTIQQSWLQQQASLSKFDGYRESEPFSKVKVTAAPAPTACSAAPEAGRTGDVVYDPHDASADWSGFAPRNCVGRRMPDGGLPAAHREVCMYVGGRGAGFWRVKKVLVGRLKVAVPGLCRRPISWKRRGPGGDLIAEIIHLQNTQVVSSSGRACYVHTYSFASYLRVRRSPLAPRHPSHGARPRDYCCYCCCLGNSATERS